MDMSWFPVQAKLSYRTCGGSLEITPTIPTNEIRYKTTKISSVDS